MLRKALLALLLMAGPACAGSSTYTPPSVGYTFSETQNASGLLMPNVSIWDSVAGANGLQINADHSAQVNNVQSGDIIVTPSSSFTGTATTTRTANTVVANSATAGSVVFLSWTVSRVTAGNAYVRRAIFTSTGKSITAPANFILYLFTGTAAPTTAAGDNAAFSGAVVLANEFCAIPITLTEKGSDVSVGRGAPDVGSECNFVAGAGVSTIWGLLVTTGAYVAAAAEVEKFILEVHQN